MVLEGLESRWLLASDWQNPMNPLDVDAGEGVADVTPLDALLIINELHQPQFSDAILGSLPALGPSDTSAPPYLDVDANGFVSPMDAMLVINELSAFSGTGQGSVPGGRSYAAAATIAGMPAALSDGVEHDTLVNSETSHPQSFPDVASNAAGDIVIVWQSCLQDGSSWGVYGQRYAADGSKVGEEFLVNTTTRGSQRNPAVAMDDDGSFVVAWQSLGQDGAGWGVYAQMFGADGQRLGGETLVNETTRGHQLRPDVVRNSAGVFTVGWEGRGRGDHHGIFVRSWTVSGTGETAELGASGPEILVNAFTAGRQSRPGLSVLPSGATVVAWDGRGPGDAQGIFMRSLAAESPDEQVVNLATDGRQVSPAISADGQGNIVVAWQQRPEANWGIWARRFDASGEGSSQIIQVNETIQQRQMGPTIDHLPDGSFAVGWYGHGQGDRRGAYARMFTAEGEAESPEMLVNRTTRSAQIRPALAAVNNGYVVTWQGLGEGDRRGVFARFFDTEITEPFTIDPMADLVVDEGQVATATATVTVQTEDVDDITFALVGSFPETATIDPETGTFSWLTTESDGGRVVEFTVVASDGVFESSTSFLVTVNEVDSPPVLAPIADQTATADQPFTLTVSATDPDLPPQALTFTAEAEGGDPLPAWLSFDAASQTFSGTAAASDAGTLSVLVTVTDPTNLSDSQVFSITVVANSAPILVTPIADQSVEEGQLFSLDVAGNFSDPDDDPLTFVAVVLTGEGSAALPAWLSFDGATGVFSGTPGNGDVDSVSIQVTASDLDQASVSDTFVLEVIDVNEFAPSITDQVFRIAPDSPGGTEVGMMVASDPDPSANLVFSILAGNDDGIFAIDAASGLITVADATALPNTPLSELQVEVTDGTFSSTATAMVYATDDPIFVAYRFTAEDLEGNAITSVGVGETFHLVMIVQDVRENSTGVFSAFADIVYPSALLSVTGDPVHSSVYPSGTSAGLGTPGLIDEAGGVDGIAELGGSEIEVLRIPMTVSSMAAGVTIHVASNATENMISHPTLLFGDDQELPSTNISFGTLSLSVEAVVPLSQAASSAGVGQVSDQSAGPVLEAEVASTLAMFVPSVTVSRPTEWLRAEAAAVRDAAIDELFGEESLDGAALMV